MNSNFSSNVSYVSSNVSNVGSNVSNASSIVNKTKVVSADLLGFDFDFEDIFMFGNISVLLTFQYW